MILVVSATNRPNSKTKLVADEVYDYLAGQYKDEVRFLDLQDIPLEIMRDDFYKPEGMHKDLMRIQDELIIPSTTLVIIAPEYNGSFPGIFKLFIDALSIRRYKENFHGKNAALIGVASGRAGNIRGMDHMAAFLNYLKITTFYDKLPLSSIESYIEEGTMKNSSQKIIHDYLDNFLNWLD
jgi:chromate reductase, NAD(P)H dehydrogenase (quinone)